MAQNLTINGVTYNGVESLSIPKSGGGNAVFTEGGGGTYQSKTVTPSASQQNITPDMGYDALSAVTVNGDADLVAGNIKKDVNIFGVVGTLESGGGLPATIVAGDTPVLLCPTLMYKPSNSSSLTSTGMSLTIPRAGTYRIKWGHEIDQDSGTIRTQLYRNGTAIGTQQSKSNGAASCSLDVVCAAGDTITLYARAGSYWGYACGACGGLVACIDWDNGF